MKTATVQIGKLSFSCEVAVTPQEKTKGLQEHASLENQQGMLFPFRPAQPVSFHMGRVSFPIDILFIEKGRIGGIASNIQPGTRGYFAYDFAEAVVELPGGTCFLRNIRMGTPVQLPDMSHLKIASTVELNPFQNEGSATYDVLRNITEADLQDLGVDDKTTRFQPEDLNVVTKTSIKIRPRAILEAELQDDGKWLVIGFHNTAMLLSNRQFVATYHPGADVDTPTTDPSEADGNTITVKKIPHVLEAEPIDKPEYIDTLEGTMHGSPGDWKVTGLDGEQWFIKPHLFEKSYEPADKDAEKAFNHHFGMVAFTDEVAPLAEALVPRDDQKGKARVEGTKQAVPLSYNFLVSMGRGGSCPKCGFETDGKQSYDQYEACPQCNWFDPTITTELEQEHPEKFGSRKELIEYGPPIEWSGAVANFL